MTRESIDNRLVETAKATRQELINASTELAALKEEMFKPGDIDLTRYSIAAITAALERVNELRRRLEGKLGGIVELPGGWKGSRLECLMIEELNLNHRFIQGDLSALVECARLRELHLSFNPSLTSLHGLPLASIEKIEAMKCNLQGDLSELACCAKLKDLNVSFNRKLTSLYGVPLASIEEINASSCNLQGNLSALADSAKLKDLQVGDNPNLTFLCGVPLASIELISAPKCNLQGDLSALTDCAKLRVLHVGCNGGIGHNGNLTSLHGVPLASIEKIVAFRCNLQGDLSALADCTKLRDLNVSLNPNLTLLHGVPLASIEKIDASSCNLQGDHSFLADAPNLKYLVLRENPGLTLDTAKFRKEVAIVR